MGNDDTTSTKPPKEERHGFIGPLYHVRRDGKSGFIRPIDIQRMDGGRLGLVVHDDVYVHIGSFFPMERQGYSVPERLEVGMVVAFFLGPSRRRDAKVTAERCTVYQAEVT